MGQTSPAAIQSEVCLRLVVPDGTALPVQAHLRYVPTDPYAVHVVFHAAGEERVTPDAPSVSWSFARDLLVTGLVEPAGIGDVRVWPWSTQGGEVVALALSSPDGHALFEAPRRTLEQFVARTFDAVPPGEEPFHLDVEQAVGRLLRR